MGAKYRVGSITPVTFFAVLSIFFTNLSIYVKNACIVSFKSIYVYKYCEYIEKITVN